MRSVPVRPDRPAPGGVDTATASGRRIEHRRREAREVTRSIITETPILQRGYHGHPREGACLTEFAATVPGGPWTDQPPGVQPMLAALARQVNDTSSDQGRIALLPWAAWLVGTAGDGQDDDLDATLAAHAGAAALRHANPVEADRITTLMAGLTRPETATPGRIQSWRRRHARRRAAGRLVRAAVTSLTRASTPDPLLRAVLADAVNTTRGHRGLDAVVVDVDGYTAWPQTQRVRGEVRIPDGGESIYLHCTALPDRWPAELTQAWAARLDELRRTPDHRRAT
jgi:hypothetical protein